MDSIPMVEWKLAVQWAATLFCFLDGNRLLNGKRLCSASWMETGGSVGSDSILPSERQERLSEPENEWYERRNQNVAMRR